jgi:hypothetical protein
MHDGSPTTMTRRSIRQNLEELASAREAVSRGRQPVGFLGPASANLGRDYFNAFQQGLKEAGFTEGSTVAIEARYG